MRTFGIPASVLAIAFLLSTPASAFSSKLDGYCSSISKGDPTTMQTCRASEAHYKGQVLRLRTWATSDQWTSCENRSSSYRTMAYCVDRAKGDRGPSVQRWNP
jgi:hypothetical protein